MVRGVRNTDKEKERGGEGEKGGMRGGKGRVRGGEGKGVRV